MKKRGMLMAEELIQPTSWRQFGAMLWWAFYYVSVIEILIFCVTAVRVFFFEKKVFWDRELVVLAISVTVVICYHAVGRKKKETIQPPMPTRGNGT
jgi:hypothetical protein